MRATCRGAAPPYAFSHLPTRLASSPTPAPDPPSALDGLISAARVTPPPATASATPSPLSRRLQLAALASQVRREEVEQVVEEDQGERRFITDRCERHYTKRHYTIIEQF